MNDSQIHTKCFLTVLLLAASLALTRQAVATETLSPLAIDRLRMVSRAVLESRANERQRVVFDSAEQRRVLADVDSRLRALEAAVKEDQLPRSSMAGSGAQAPQDAAAVNRTRAKRASPTLSGTRDSSPDTENAAPMAPPAKHSSAASITLIDEALAALSVHRRNLSKRPSSRGAAALRSTSQTVMPRPISASASQTIAQDRLAEALSDVDTALRRMRVHGADVQGLRHARDKVSLAFLPTPQEITPTLQTITKHYR